MEREFFGHTGCKNIEAFKFKRYWSGDSLIGIQCDVCLSEWLLDEYLPRDNLGCEVKCIDRRQFRLMQKPAVNESTFKAEPAAKKIKLEISNLAEYLVPGDHIKYIWCCGFFHHAIVKDVTRDHITLIHYHGDYGSSSMGSITEKPNAKVTEEKISLNKMKKEVREIFHMEYRGGAVQEGCVQEDSKTLTLARAKAWLGVKYYNLFTNNCEHFAVYCKIGQHWSFQKDQLYKTVMTFLHETGIHICISLGIETVSTIMEITISKFSKVSLLTPLMQLIGLGLVVVIQGVAFLLDLKELYKKRNDKDIGEEEFVGRFWHNIYSRLDKVFYTGVVPAACVVTLGAILPACMLSTATSVLVGAICAGFLTVPWGCNGQISLAGHMLSGFVTMFIKYRNDAIDDIRDLTPGDHIVLYRWFLHPRCHMIVTSVDESSGSMCVIRFTYHRGVVEEKFKFHTPLYKVVHERPFTPDVIIHRARQLQFPAKAYNICHFNCEHFAFWCETNTWPYGP